MTDGAGEPWGLAAAALAVAAAWVARPASVPERAPDLRLPAVLVGAYVAAGFLLPPLLAAAVGATSLVTLLAALRRERPSLALLGLAVLSLPDVSTLQFFVGWPFRVGVATVAAPVLRIAGFDVAREGTMLVSCGRAVAVDAPCSGVWMLWGGLVLALALAAFARLPAGRTAAVVLAVLPAVFTANLLRSVGAFLLETMPRATPGWAHDGVGVVAFAAAAGAVLAVVDRLGRCRPCAA